MSIHLAPALALLHQDTHKRLIDIPCFLGSPRSADPKLSFIEIESRMREKIRVNSAELRQV